jgi:DNA invertase Pin-like site-specific DNA recombinase
MSTEETAHRAVTYLRVASAHQEDQGAIDRQREGCQRIAERHGLTVIREYVDVGRPARLDQQMELRRLLDDLMERQDAAFVIVWDYARLGRSMEQLDDVISRIKLCGAEVATITGVEAAARLTSSSYRDEADRS